MLKKIEVKYKFKKKRNYNIITPCCNRNNKDGKFVNFESLPNIYGYCNSCAKTSLPKSIYENEEREQFIWNETTMSFERLLNASQLSKQHEKLNVHEQAKSKVINFIPESIIWEFFNVMPENNLLKYLRQLYGDQETDKAKEMYAIGTSKEHGVIFWNINKDLKVQKAKISFYNNLGKRTNKFKVPYKNDEGYYSCLFGEHLIIDKFKGKQLIVLVESEKTAIVGSINMPKYTWLAYGGANGLTDEKSRALIGHKVLVIPDISNTATQIMYKKLHDLLRLGVNAKIWDMTNGKSDSQLKKEGIYNMDIEDYIRLILNKP